MKDITNDKIGRMWRRYINHTLKHYKRPVTSEEIEAWRANFYAGAYSTIQLVFAPFDLQHEAGKFSPEDICEWLIELKVELELEVIVAAGDAAKNNESAQTDGKNN